MPPPLFRSERKSVPGPAENEQQHHRQVRAGCRRPSRRRAGALIVDVSSIAFDQRMMSPRHAAIAGQASVRRNADQASSRVCGAHNAPGRVLVHAD